MSITQLFLNLDNYIKKGNNLSFSESDITTALESLDFTGVPKQRKCKKGYPCRKSCINKGYSCKDPLTGQAKTYAQWLELQAKVKIVEPEPTPEIVVNLADFESVKRLGEKIANKYGKNLYEEDAIEIEKQLEELNKEVDLIISKMNNNLENEKVYFELEKRLIQLSDLNGDLITKLQAAKSGVPLEEYIAFKDAESEYQSAKIEVSLAMQGKSIALKNLSDRELEDEKNRIFSDFMAKENEFFRRKRGIDKDLTGLSDIYKNLVTAGGKSEADANTWLDSLGKRTAKVKKSDQALKDAYQLTGGNIPTLRSVIYDKPRAYANKGAGVINVGKSEQKAVIFHEVGHHLEYSNPELKESANAFLQKRSTGQKETLRKITGNQAYKANEVALTDSFINPYVGKIYKDGSTEVISMGLERFSTPEAMKKFRDQDPEHFHYILGVLAYVNNLKP